MSVADWARLFIQAVDDALSMFGHTVKEVVLFYAKTKYGINETEIPFKLELFEDCLYEIFGEASKIIVRQIIEKFSERAEFRVKVERLCDLSRFMEGFPYPP
ncbi:MAG: hypothetical protein DRN06_01430 [Thermoprotei archaeon]|nr:MAG: hypothetical protein DRN06_01430 [Thermoprotei archaeon]